jgi:hypothetical protein
LAGSHHVLSASASRSFSLGAASTQARAYSTLTVASTTWRMGLLQGLGGAGFVFPFLPSAFGPISLTSSMAARLAHSSWSIMPCRSASSSSISAIMPKSMGRDSRKGSGRPHNNNTSSSSSPAIVDGEFASISSPSSALASRESNLKALMTMRFGSGARARAMEKRLKLFNADSELHAFVTFADTVGARNATIPALKVFGLVIGEYACPVVPAADLTSLVVRGAQPGLTHDAVLVLVNAALERSGMKAKALLHRRYNVVVEAGGEIMLSFDSHADALSALHTLRGLSWDTATTSQFPPPAPAPAASGGFTNEGWVMPHPTQPSSSSSAASSSATLVPGWATPRAYRRISHRASDPHKIRL